MRVKLYKRKGKTGSTLYLHITAPGQPRIRERLDIQLTGEKEADRERLHQAKHIRAIREAQLLAGKYNIESTLGESLSFIEYFGKLAMTRHRTWKSTQNHLITFCGSRNPMLKDIDESWLESFKKYLLAPAATSGAVLNANTAGIYFSKIKAALNIALRSRLIHRNPGSIVAGIAKEDVQRNYLTMVELRTLSDSECPNDGVKNAFLFACYTGLRYCDIIGLRWKDVRNNQLEVRQKKTKSLVYIPLSDGAMRFLPTLIREPADLVFDLQLSHSGVWKYLQRWAKVAGVRPFGFHIARHTFATLLISGGAELFVVSKLLGHKDIRHTQLYAKVADNVKRKTVDLIPSL